MGANAMLAPLTTEELRNAAIEVPSDAAERPKPIVPVPNDAPPMEFRHPKYGKPARVWWYRDAVGRRVGCVARWDIVDDEGQPDKAILPIAYCELPDGARGWRAAGLPDPRPLYRWPELLARPDAVVIVTEGEKAADAAAYLFPDAVATTAMHGAKSPHLTDWSPLAGRTVVIATDHDIPGRTDKNGKPLHPGKDYGDTAARLCREAGAAEVLALPPDRLGAFVIQDGRPVLRDGDLPDGWDLADAVDEGWTSELVAEAGALERLSMPYPLIPDVADDAERPLDPLDNLAERTVADPGAPFAPDVLERLAALRREDRAAFEALRAQLKAANCRVTELDKAIAATSGDAGRRGPTQADILIDLAQTADLFHTADGTAYADLIVNGHRETWPIRSRGFKRWLARRFFEETAGAPNSEAMQSALGVIEAKAHFDAPERAVFVRVGECDGRLYLDLCDESWQAVEIDAAGWRVIDTPPVRFRRAAGMQALPVPERGGSIAALRRFLNVRSDSDFVLAVAWLLACLRPRGPYPLLALTGEQGSAKSTFSAILRKLIDPNTAPLRALPREDRDLFIAANNGHVLAFDNLSGLPPWTSDTLCRLATGGGFAVRSLYTDGDEMLFDAARPLILNGISDIITRPDLADRALFLTLEPIPEERRRPEAELWAEFEAERPRILGALLDAVARGLARLPHTRLERLPRMADFALWGTACETAFWPAGTFEGAYGGNRDEAVEGVIDADPVAAAVRDFMDGRTEWAGTASDLLDALGALAGETQRRAKGWPGTAHALSGRLRRAATFLRKFGIEIAAEREGKERRRVLYITATPAFSEADRVGNSASAALSGPEKDGASCWRGRI